MFARGIWAAAPQPGLDIHKIGHKKITLGSCGPSSKASRKPAGASRPRRLVGPAPATENALARTGWAIVGNGPPTGLERGLLEYCTPKSGSPDVDRAAAARIVDSPDVGRLERAAVLLPSDRSAFLCALANVLRGEPQPLSDGSVHRAIRALQREFRTPPTSPAGRKRRGALSASRSSDWCYSADEAISLAYSLDLR